MPGAQCGDVTHRIDVKQDQHTVVFEFHGLLDEEALRGLRETISRLRESGEAVRVVLRAGAEVERSCLPELRTLDAAVTAESPYLARWLARD